MDLFDSALKNELADDYEDLMQIIDDYLERPRRSELSVINTAQKIYEQVEQATSDIGGTSQFIPEPTVVQAETSNTSPMLQTTETKEFPQSSQSSNPVEFHAIPTTARAPTPTIISTPPATIKPPDDDDVVYISSEPSGPSVIDLLTPTINTGRKRNRRRAIEDVITLDDTWPEPELPKRPNARESTCTTVQPSPPVKLQSPPSENQGNGLKLKCAVCMDDPIKNEPTTTICGHIFCKKCIYRAIKISRRCPLCNKKINSTTQVHRLYV